MKKAIVIGATGMVGTQLIQLLIGNEDFSEIVTLVRRKSGVSNPKLTEYIINFDEPETWKNYVTGDVLFSTMGTTMAQVKTKKAQYDVDFNYQFTVAKIAANNGVSSYVLVSSAGANPTSKNFYLKMKGELEFAVQSLPFKTVIILQPGQLTGNRIHNRRSEKIGIIIMDGLNKLGLFKRYKPIHAFTVASDMIKAVKVKVSSIYSLDEIFKLAD
jgi:uncharacterized protein YbjT (DUF2867 family)